MNEKYKLLEDKRQQEAKKAEANKLAPASQDKEHYEDVDHIINAVIENIWDEFDDDGNGTLDLEETKEFVKTTLIEMGEKPDYTEQDLLECFKYFLPGGA